MEKGKNEVTALENVEVVNAEHEMVIKLVNPYEFEGTTYTEIDLTSLENIKGKDMIAIQKEVDKAGGFSIIPEMSTQYALLAAARMTGLPIEFFENLDARAVLVVKNRVIGFFYKGE